MLRYFILEVFIDMSTDNQQSTTRLATRLAFLVAGFGIACWAPLVPFVKQKLAVDEGVLGLLLLCIGIGSVIAMSLGGILATRYGSKPVIIISGFGLALILPFIILANSVNSLAITLLAFGAALGSLDVAINIHAVEVEQRAQRPLMSGFHALFSAGGFVGAGAMTLLLSINISVLTSCIICSVLMLIAMQLASSRLHNTAKTEDGPLFAIPKGIVALLALLTAATFLLEGAILDWSALLITDAGLVSQSQGGIGYMLFAISMTLGRFAGDKMALYVSDQAIIFWGGMLGLLGLVVLLSIPSAVFALSGFLLIGFGVSNIVPVLFRRAGKQNIMPPGLAVAAITIAGYTGILLGPASVGFVADLMGLPASFWMLAALLLLVALCAGRATRAS